MKALLIIDMQKGSFAPITPRHDADGVVKRINQLSAAFRKLNWPVICVQHDGTKIGEFVKGTEEWENLDDLIIKEDDIQIDKYANDIFYKSNLQSILNKLGIYDVVITGCATDFCVEASIHSALSKDYNITVVADGHTTGNRPHLRAQKVIEHYNWVWQNMIPTNGKIEMKSAGALQTELIGIQIQER